MLKSCLVFSSICNVSYLYIIEVLNNVYGILVSLWAKEKEKKNQQKILVDTFIKSLCP